MKRSIVLILMVAIVGMISVAALAAEGQQERWDGSTQAQNPDYNGERLSVEGSVDLTASGAELKAADGQEYELMYPRFLADGVEIKDGDTVLVEGYLVPGPRWNWGEDENNLRVDKVTLNGEEYDLAENFGPGHGPRGGAYGPRACWGEGNTGYGPQGGSYGPGARGSRGSYGGHGPGMMGGQGRRW